MAAWLRPHATCVNRCFSVWLCAQAKALGIPHTEVTIQDPYLESYRVGQRIQ